MSEAPKDVAAEIAYQARHVAALDDVPPTAPEIFERYRRCAGWRIFRKEYVFRLIQRCAPRQVLDFGCGDGDISVEIAALGCEVTGIDVSPDLIARARRRAELDGLAARCRFICADASAESLPEAAYDLVAVQAVLHHVEMAPCLDVIHRALRPGGFAVIAEPVAYSRVLQWLRDRTSVEKDISPNERQLGHADMAAIARRFEIVERRHFHLLMRLSRVFPQRLHRALLWMDYLLLKIPGVSHFAGIVVMLARKRG